MNEYEVIINNDELNKINHKKIKNIKINDEKIVFETDARNLKVLINEIENISYKNKTKAKLKLALKHYLISFLAILIICFLLINQSKCIRKINFINYNSYDAEVEAFIIENLKKVGPYYYLNTSINDLNFELKNAFYQYEWISLTKKGAYLNVNIKKQDELEKIKPEDNRLGDFYASRNAIVVKYYLTSGISLIQEGQFVKKGDILITGNLLYKSEGKKYISPKASIIGEVYDFHDICVEKVQIKTIKTGRLKISSKTVLFNKNIEVNSSFTNGEIIIKNKINIFNIIKVNNYYDYEIKESKTVYNMSDALEFAKSKIRKQIVLDEYEEIKYLDALSFSEDDNNFYFKIIVKLHINIGEFVELKN